MKLPKWFLKFCGEFRFCPHFPWFAFMPPVYRVKGYEIRQLINACKPGDILLRRWNGYLSNVGIQGFWCHCAIVIDKETVIHAVGTGVEQEDILDFCRSDSVVLLRPNNLKAEFAERTVLNAKRHLKAKAAYDFDFKDHNGKVYCSELVNICCQDIFNHDYVETYGNKVLLPAGIYNSKMVHKILEFRHEK